MLHTELEVTGLAVTTARLCSPLDGAREPERAEAAGVARLRVRRGEVHPEALRHRLARVHSRTARAGGGAA